MADRSQFEFRTTALDPDLLDSPFKVQTNWHVITGAPSCGKTTLINLLAEKGLKTVPEVARQYLEGELGQGRTIEEIRQDCAGLQRRIKELQQQVEAGLGVTDSIFLDGAVPSSLAWYRAFGLDPNDILAACFNFRYASVFILDRLPVELDGLRFDDESFHSYLDGWIRRDYCALGYRVVRVPVLSPTARLGYVFERLPRQSMRQRPDGAA